MFLLMCVAAAVCVVQLGLLASWARSLRVGTLLLVVPVGFAACGTVAVLLQLAWTRAVAALDLAPLRSVVTVAGYTLDPAIEEVVKLAPLVLLAVRWRAVHRQLGLTDHLLLGASLGVGFELFEATLRHSTVGALTMAVPSGYLVSAGLGGTVTVPSLTTSLTSWQPVPAAFQKLFDPSADTVQHLVWTALAGAGLGWVTRTRGPARWAGLAGLVVAVLDHANYNLRAANAVPAGLRPLSGGVQWLGGTLPTLLLVALVAGVLLDRYRLAAARSANPGVLLPGEAPRGTTPAPVAAAAFVAAPWSAWTTWRFVLARRACLHAAALGSTELVSAVSADRERLQAARSVQAWERAGSRQVAALRAGLRSAALSPATALWLVASLPGLLYLVVGAFPATSGLQRALRGETGLWLLLVAALAAVVNLALQARTGVARLRLLPVPSLHERALPLQSRVLAATGGLLAAGPLLAQSLVLRDPARRLVSNYHALDALGNALVVLGLALLVLSFFLFPPFGLAVTTAGTLVLVPTLTGAFVTAAAGSATLAGLGVLLSEASEGTDSGGSAQGSSGGAGGSAESAAAREQRIQDLARDPADGGKISAGSRAEAEVGVGLEESGQVQGLRRSTNAAEEFVDAQNRPWDVKAFHSEQGRFNLDTAMRKIWQEMNWSKENIMLDTRNLSAGDLQALREAVQAAKARGELPLEVLWWP